MLNFNMSQGCDKGQQCYQTKNKLQWHNGQFFLNSCWGTGTQKLINWWNDWNDGRLRPPFGCEHVSRLASVSRLLLYMYMGIAAGLGIALAIAKP
jgi:hypothetical protein